MGVMVAASWMHGTQRASRHRHVASTWAHCTAHSSSVRFCSVDSNFCCFAGNH